MRQKQKKNIHRLVLLCRKRFEHYIQLHIVPIFSFMLWLYIHTGEVNLNSKAVHASGSIRSIVYVDYKQLCGQCGTCVAGALNGRFLPRARLFYGKFTIVLNKFCTVVTNVLLECSIVCYVFVEIAASFLAPLDFFIYILSRIIYTFFNAFHDFAIIFVFKKSYL